MDELEQIKLMLDLAQQNEILNRYNQQLSDLVDDLVDGKLEPDKAKKKLEKVLSESQAKLK